MAARLPVNLRYRLPAGWVSVSPDEVGAHTSAFFALHRHSVEGEFAANITISGGLWPSPAPLSEIADSTVNVLRENPILSQIEIVERREINLPGAPDLDSPEVRGMRQVVRARKYEDFSEQWLIQTQVYLLVPYPPDPQRQAVVNISFSATPTQFDQLSGDFEFFVRGILQRTLGVKSFGGLGKVDWDKVAGTANAAADAVRDIAASADEWVPVGWDSLAESDGST